MPFMTLKFGKLITKSKRYVTRSMDVWNYKKTTSSLNVKIKYVHHIELKERKDGQNSPIEAMLLEEKSFRSVIYMFPIGEVVKIHSKHESVQITYYVCSPKPGQLASDLMTHALKNQDVTLKSRCGKTFSINRFLFEARSEVFAAMFAHGTVEAQENAIEFDLSASALEDLVSFLKTDKVPNMDANAFELGYLSHGYGLPLLFQLVESYLASHITEKNIDDVSKFVFHTSSTVLHRALGDAPFQPKPKKLKQKDSESSHTIKVYEL